MTKRGDCTTINAHIGRRIRQLRTQRSLTLQELATRVGVTYQQIQRYEHGHNGVSICTLLTIAGVLRARLGWFIEGLEPDQEA